MQIASAAQDATPATDQSLMQWELALIKEHENSQIPRQPYNPKAFEEDPSDKNEPAQMQECIKWYKPWSRWARPEEKQEFHDYVDAIKEICQNWQSDQPSQFKTQ